MGHDIRYPDGNMQHVEYNRKGSVTIQGVGDNDCFVAPAFIPSVPITASYTLGPTDINVCADSTAPGAIAVTLPPNAAVPIPVGAQSYACQQGAGQITIAAGAGVTIRTPRSATTRAQWSTVSFRKIGTDTWLLGGDLT